MTPLPLFQRVLDDYSDLHKWSVDNIADFWSEVWDFCDVVSSKKWDEVIDLSIRMDAIPAWFTGAKLNWAENMLRCRSADKVALVETSASSSPLFFSIPPTHVSFTFQVNHSSEVLSLTPDSLTRTSIFKSIVLSWLLNPFP